MGAGRPLKCAGRRLPFGRNSCFSRRCSAGSNFRQCWTLADINSCNAVGVLSLAIIIVVGPVYWMVARPPLAPKGASTVLKYLWFRAGLLAGWCPLNARWRETGSGGELALLFVCRRAGFGVDG